MALDDLLFIIGAATVLFGVVGGKLSPTIAKRRRWILIVGVGILIVWGVPGMPAFVEGVREGFSEARD